MKRGHLFKTAFLLTLLVCVGFDAHSQHVKKYVLVIHGGAGTITPSKMTREKELKIRSLLTQALQAGFYEIKSGKNSLDAVESVIKILEDSPLFNAGKGAVFTHEGKNELDASIMDGKTLKAGAVAGVTTVKNPISAARAVMEKSEHVFMSGAGAEKFAKEAGIEMVNPSYFFTKERWDALHRAIRADSVKSQLDHDDKKSQRMPGAENDFKFGTVGAVALDKNGNLAAGTSTGGMTNKKYGRIGDSPVIGAGTYANNKTVAVSCTGWGEFYLRSVVAYDVSALMEYKGLLLEAAAGKAIEKMAKLGGNGGLIALDKNGNMATPFNTAGMYRGAVTASGEIEIKFYKER